MADTNWLNTYEETNVECGEAAAQVALEDSPRAWPIFHDATWNPDGYPLSPYPTEKIPEHN